MHLDVGGQDAGHLVVVAVGRGQRLHQRHEAAALTEDGEAVGRPHGERIERRTPGQLLEKRIADTPFVTAAVGALDEYVHDVDVTIDFGLTPEAYCEELFGLLHSVVLRDAERPDRIRKKWNLLRLILFFQPSSFEYQLGDFLRVVDCVPENRVVQLPSLNVANTLFPEEPLHLEFRVF